MPTRSVPALERLLDVHDVSKLTGVPVDTLYAWSTRNLGPPRLKLGRHLRYDPADIRAWLDARRKGGDAA